MARDKYGIPGLLQLGCQEILASERGDVCPKLAAWEVGVVGFRGTHWGAHTVPSSVPESPCVLLPLSFT